MIDSMSNGTVPPSRPKLHLAVKYYSKGTRSGDRASKDLDKFLYTDVIATEQYISTAYSNDLFYFASPEVSNALNAIMTYEQNHAEMIWNYETCAPD